MQELPILRKGNSTMNTRTIAAPQLVAQSNSRNAIRLATALLMTFAAALILVHAQVYSGGALQAETGSTSIDAAYLH
jgi:hypothetical protein